jgi:hypothetical protein
MEWMLQVIDEFDDFASSLALLWVGARRGVALALAGIAGAAALVAVTALGMAPVLICASAVLLSAASALSVNARFAGRIR